TVESCGTSDIKIPDSDGRELNDCYKACAEEDSCLRFSYRPKANKHGGDGIYCRLKTKTGVLNTDTYSDDEYDVAVTMTGECRSRITTVSAYEQMLHDPPLDLTMAGDHWRIADGYCSGDLLGARRVFDLDGSYTVGSAEYKCRTGQGQLACTYFICIQGENKCAGCTDSVPAHDFDTSGGTGTNVVFQAYVPISSRCIMKPNVKLTGNEFSLTDAERESIGVLYEDCLGWCARRESCMGFSYNRARNYHPCFPKTAWKASNEVNDQRFDSVQMTNICRRMAKDAPAYRVHLVTKSQKLPDAQISADGGKGDGKSWIRLACRPPYAVVGGGCEITQAAPNNNNKNKGGGGGETKVVKDVRGVSRSRPYGDADGKNGGWECGGPEESDTSTWVGFYDLYALCSADIPVHKVTVSLKDKDQNDGIPNDGVAAATCPDRSTTPTTDRARHYTRLLGGGCWPTVTKKANAMSGPQMLDTQFRHRTRDTYQNGPEAYQCGEGDDVEKEITALCTQGIVPVVRSGWIRGTAKMADMACPADGDWTAIGGGCRKFSDSQDNDVRQYVTKAMPGLDGNLECGDKDKEEGGQIVPKAVSVICLQDAPLSDID
ncbi:unnamed protein product, partial [Amoebophrya sp. A25]